MGDFIFERLSFVLSNVLFSLLEPIWMLILLPYYLIKALFMPGEYFKNVANLYSKAVKENMFGKDLKKKEEEDTNK